MIRAISLIMFWGGALLGLPGVSAAAPKGGLAEFLTKMQRHPVDVKVLRRAADGTVAPIGAGVAVEFDVLAGGAKVRDFEEQTDDDGVAHFAGIPTNPNAKGQIGYEVAVVHQGVRFPFSVDQEPDDGTRVEVEVTDVSTDLSQLSLSHAFVEMFPDEDSLVVRHRFRLENGGATAINLGALVDGGLRIPMPDGAKRPDTHEEIVEARGASVYYKGAILPGAQHGAEFTVIYTIPYRGDVFDWNQVVPGVRTVGALVVAPRGRTEHQRLAIDLTLIPRDGIGLVKESQLGDGKVFSVLRATGLKLAPGQPFRFTIAGLPAPSPLGRVVLYSAVALVAAIVLFGFRRPVGVAGERLSRVHLETERDRLVAALGRMKRAFGKGRITEAFYEREREAIKARMVVLYRALDRLDGRA